MARKACTKCGKTTREYTNTAKDAEGHGTKPVCDDCLGTFVKPGRVMA